MSKLKEMHALVQALEKSEKRAFHLDFAENQSVKLFDVLADQPEFDEAQVMRKLSRAGLAAQLPTHLHRLRKMVVKSQVVLQADKSVGSRLRFALAEIDLLYRKKLLDQIPARIQPARKLARRFSRFAEELQFIDWSRKVLFEAQPNRVHDAYLALRKEESEVLEALSLQREVTDLQLRMRSLSREILSPGTPEDVQRYEAIRLHPSVKTALESPDFLTAVSAGIIKGQYEMALRRYDQAWKSYSEVMERWRNDAAWINEQTDTFLSCFNNYQMSVLLNSEVDYAASQEYAEFFASQTFHEPMARLRFEQIDFVNRLLILLNQGNFDEGLDLSEEIKVWLAKNNDSLPKTTWLSFQYNLAVFHFLAGQPSPANRRVQSILNLPEGEQRKDIRDFARLFELVLHYELGNHDLLEYRVRAAQRHFAESSQKSPMAEAVMDFFRPDKQEAGRAKMENLRRRLQDGAKAELGRTEIEIWVEAHLRGLGIPEVFLERLGRDRS